MNQRVDKMIRHMKERERQLRWRSRRDDDENLAKMADQCNDVATCLEKMRGRESLTENEGAILSLAEMIAQFDDLQADYRVMPEHEKARLDPETRHSLETGEPPSRRYIFWSLTWGRLRNWLLGI